MFIIPIQFCIFILNVCRQKLWIQEPPSTWYASNQQLFVCLPTTYVQASRAALHPKIHASTITDNLQLLVKTQYTQLCIGSSTKTLIFFRDAEMAWTTQLSDVPVIVRLMNLRFPYRISNHYKSSYNLISDSLRSMVVILTSENKIIVGYLGTEPALFRMPVTQSRSA